MCVMQFTVEEDNLVLKDLCEHDVKPYEHDLNWPLCIPAYSLMLPFEVSVLEILEQVIQCIFYDLAITDDVAATHKSTNFQLVHSHHTLQTFSKCDFVLLVASFSFGLSADDDCGMFLLLFSHSHINIVRPGWHFGYHAVDDNGNFLKLG